LLNLFANRELMFCKKTCVSGDTSG